MTCVSHIVPPYTSIAQQGTFLESLKIIRERLEFLELFLREIQVEFEF